MNRELTNSPTPHSKQKKWLVPAFSATIGFLLCGIATFLLMPRLMIVTKECQYGFDETVDKLQTQIKAAGWVVVGGHPSSMNDSLAQQGRDFKPRVTLVKLCHPDYAKSVLTTDRHVACMMPCTMAVWEGENGKTYLSKMNMGLMGKMFGGNIAKVMGTKVATDEQQILNGLLN